MHRSQDNYQLFFYLSVEIKNWKQQKEQGKMKLKPPLPEKCVFAFDEFGDEAEEKTSGISGIGLRRGFLEAISLSPYKDFFTFFFLLFP